MRKENDKVESIELVVGETQTQVYKEEEDGKISQSHIDSQNFDIQKFNFNDYNPGSQYDVVINEDGNSVPISAPKSTYYNQPRDGFLTHHLYFGCETPINFEKTVIPAAGMYDFFS